MDGTNTLWERLRNFLRNYLVEFVSTLGAAGVLFGEFHAIQDTSLNDVVDRIYINVKDLPFQSLGALANILSDVKKGLIQDSHIWSFFSHFSTISVDNQLKSDLSVCLSFSDGDHVLSSL